MSIFITGNFLIEREGTASALSEADCRTCHGQGTSTSTVHHPLVYSKGYACAVCHATVWVPSCNCYDIEVIRDCVVCHGPAAHDEAHDKATIPSPDCAECHAPNVVTEHVTNRNLSCAVCHASPDPVVQNVIALGRGGQTVYCTDCHAEAASHTAAHDMATVPSPDCLQCHVANVVTEHVTNKNLSCAVCHSNPNPVVQNVIALGRSGQAVYCTDCHADAASHTAAHDMVGTPYVACSNCHSVNVVTEHVTNRGLECSTCHANQDPVIQNTITQGRNGQQVYCANCHTAFGNHDRQHNSVFLPSPACAECHSMTFVGIHATGSIPTYCFTCHTSINASVIAAINDGMAGNPVTCSACHSQIHGIGNQAPVADAGPDKTVQTGQSVSFSAQGSYDPDGTIVTFHWNFGDGNTGTGMNITNVYSSAGTYTVTLTVVDDKGAASTDIAVVMVQATANMPPVAVAGTDQTANVGQSVSFSGAGSYDPDGYIVSYSWNFGDGTSGSGSSVSHAYSAAGTYTVTLTVTDNKDATGTDTAIVTIGSAASGNLALGKTVSASGYEGSSYGPQYAVDGNMNTRWWKKSKDTQWITVDLGSSMTVSKVTLYWHSYYAKEYEVRKSNDNRNWSSVKKISEGNGGRNDVTFSATSTRYVQIRCTKAASEDNGYSLYEFEVYR